ncbi:hypothetical protein EJ03DRAFT_355936 [Teratosphaeria nubilosa]|uniref:Gfd2/YDR514C-like C-terminal domain-containing protein n=1 Tax=Teratosphaeria nubilosa TaxID=161662 RepID=A0A6G1KUE1_9PEZI|nr:hypothetical protein EJ03DRAFT_355936 [Teratosphaeria nubilosa]
MPYTTPVRQEITLLQHLLGITSAGTAREAPTDPVFISIDCEAFEHDQSKITEVGVAVLDCRDVSGLDPHGRQQWLNKMKYAHFRPVEYWNLVNKRFIKGCAESFNFGTTTWVMEADIAGVLKRVFRSPSQLANAATFDNDFAPEDRNVIFVGHGAANDEQYLRRLGFSLRTDAVISRTMDTQQLAGGGKKNGVALWRLALSLSLDAVNLHNAGNDAAYTLQALVAIALKEHVVPNSTLVDLAKLQGKAVKNPDKHNRRIAPQVWQGTATRRGSASTSTPATVHAVNRVRQVLSSKERRQHKTALRAAQASSLAKSP